MFLTFNLLKDSKWMLEGKTLSLFICLFKVVTFGFQSQKILYI